MNSQYPKKIGFETVLKNAFFYWSKTILFQMLYTFVYLSILFVVFYYFASKYGILEDYLVLSSKIMKGNTAYQSDLVRISENPNFQVFSYLILGTLVFLYPLNMGLYTIYKKIDAKEGLKISDLFSGYNGLDFFKFTSYYLFWVMVFLFASRTIVLGLVWMALTIFTGPLMLFKNVRIFESIPMNVKAYRYYFIEIVFGLFLAFIFKLIGWLVIFLLPFTYAFTNAMIYSLYQAIFTEQNEEIFSKKL